MPAGAGAGILILTGLLAAVIDATAGCTACALPVDFAQTVFQRVEAVVAVVLAVICMFGQKWMRSVSM